jgi:hypothetical protein
MSQPSTVLVIGRNYWGRGKDLAEAKRQYRKAGGGPLSNGYAIVEFPPELTFTGVDMLGQVHYLTHDGVEPTVTQVAPRGKNAVWAR